MCVSQVWAELKLQLDGVGLNCNFQMNPKRLEWLKH